MATIYKSRSGRIIKKPDLYEPTERPDDDFAEDEYDEDDNEDDEEDEEDEDDEDDDNEDADDNGNLKGFVVEEEEEESDCD